MSFVFRKLYSGETADSQGEMKFKKLTTAVVVEIPTQTFPLGLLVIPAGTYELSATALSEGLLESDYSNEETYVKN